MRPNNVEIDQKIRAHFAAIARLMDVADSSGNVVRERIVRNHEAYGPNRRDTPSIPINPDEIRTRAETTINNLRAQIDELRLLREAVK